LQGGLSFVRFIYSKFADLLVSPSHQRHFKMAAELGVASVCDAPCRWYIRYTTDLCWHSTIRRNNECAILL